MVDPLDLHHMVGQTPLVEKTVAAQRENAQQLHNQNAQIQRVRQHQEEKVQRQPESAKIETPPGREQRREETQAEKGGAGAGEPAAAAETVQRVSEKADEPEHKLDVTL